MTGGAVPTGIARGNGTSAIFSRVYLGDNVGPLQKFYDEFAANAKLDSTWLKSLKRDFLAKPTWRGLKEKGKKLLLGLLQSENWVTRIA